jgi:hypothetical protein
MMSADEFQITFLPRYDPGSIKTTRNPTASLSVKRLSFSLASQNLTEQWDRHHTTIFSFFVGVAAIVSKTATASSTKTWQDFGCRAGGNDHRSGNRVKSVYNDLSTALDLDHE